MNPERWQRLKAVFVDLVERDPAERERVLLELSAGDASLAAEARSLLRGYDEASTRLMAERALPAPPPPAPRGDLVGRDIGPYRLTALLGGGGMGMVYEGRRAEDGKRVAVKILHGGDDAAELERQVAAERRILAGLEHDNIARLIDGGITGDGLPYFTLEFVEGRPIAEFCAERSLGVEARLRLFASLCSAVQYAHQRLVVHCDIKPGNVLVTDAGVPKLLDFGIARLVQPQAADGDAPTVRISNAMTPGYASPEQVRGGALTTATDVYALGLLLYELLADRPAQPLRAFVPDEIVRVVCERDPPRPSVVAPKERRRELAGDLDAVVLRALRKEPGQRYASAAALADDLERHLERRPVAARRGTLVYLTSRFLRRHWLPASAAAALVLLSVIAAGVTATQSRRADRERAKAEQVTEFLVDLFKVSDPDEARGNAVTAREVLDAGARRIDEELRDQPDVQATLLSTIGRVYVNLGLYAEATRLHRQALAVRRRTSGAERSIEIADSLDQVGRSLFYESKYPEAEAMHRESLAMREGLRGSNHPSSAETLDNLAKAVSSQGRYKEAETLHRQALALYRAAHGAESPEAATGLSNLASDLFDEGDFAAAESLNREALALRRRTLGPEHRMVAWSLNNLANALQQQKKLSEAEAMHREVVAMLRKVHGDEHPDVAVALGSLAIDLYKQGRNAESEAVHRQELAINRKLLGNDSFAVAATLFNLGEVLLAEGRFAELVPVERETLALLRKLLGPGHEYCGKSLATLAVALAVGGRSAEAEAAGREALALAHANHPLDSGQVAAAENTLAVALAAAEKLAEAETLVAHARTVDGADDPPFAALESIARRFEAAGRRAEGARIRSLRRPAAVAP